MEKKVVDAMEAAKMLAVNRKTVYRMIEEGRLHAVRVGRLWRIPIEALEEFLRWEGGGKR